jgi:beta-glucosidase
VPGVVSPLQGITQRGLADGDLVTYADGTVMADAVAAAATADTAVVFASVSNSEGVDATNLHLNSGYCTLLGCLPGLTDQDKLIAAVAAANKNTVVVLNNGGPVLMPWLSSVKGVVEAWYPGQEDGNATAAILFGDVNPSGKLPVTFPKSASDLPIKTAAQWPGVNGHSTYSEKLLVGYRWYDAKHIAPLFPFGFGLSYTTFRYSNLAVAPSPGGAAVSFDVTNTGDRTGAEVPQLYVADPATTGEPPLQLKGYSKVELLAGQTQRVTLNLDQRAFSYWSTAANNWAVAPGCYGLFVGSSSQTLPLQGALAEGGGSC